MKKIKKLSKNIFFSKTLKEAIENLLNFKRIIIHKDNFFKLYSVFSSEEISLECNQMIFFPSCLRSLLEKKKNPLEYYVVNIARRQEVSISQIERIKIK